MSRKNRSEYDDWKGFGARTRKTRECLGLTREKVSEMIDRTENYVLSMEKGDKSCSIHTLHQICLALREKADYLLYGKIEDMKEEYTNKEVLLEIINKCNEKELKVIKNVIVAMYPSLKAITETEK